MTKSDSNKEKEAASSEEVLPSRTKGSPSADAARKAIYDGTSPIFNEQGTRLTAAEISEISIRPFSFLNPRLPGQLEMRQLNKGHELFAKHLSAKFSTLLRMEVALRVSKLENITFSKFRDGIGSLTHVTLFQVDPLPGVGVLDMSLPLAFAIADRLLGGTGRVQETGRSLTEIESALVEDSIQLIVAEWCRQWRDEQWDFQPRCIGSETSGRFLQTAPMESIVLALEMEVVLGESVEKIQIGIPYSIVEVIVKRMQQARAKGDLPKAKKMSWRLSYNGISMPVTVEMDAKERKLSEIIALQPGDIIEMPNDALDHALVRLSNRPEYIGTVGIENGRVAVQLTKQLSAD